ncbi:hypothetical protein PC116_g34936, partial [Phytophthora cactorum]
FFKKSPVEKALEEAEKPKKDDSAKSPSDLKFLDDPVLYIKEKLDLFTTIAANDPIQAIKFVPEVPGAIVAILALVGTIVSVLFLGGSAPEPVKKAAADAKEKAKDAKDKTAEAVATGAENVKAEVSKRTTRQQS